MKLLNSLFHDFHSKEVLYCHWKSTEHLEATFKGKTDVDVLVSIKDRLTCESILISAGFKRFETNFFRMYPGIYDYLGYDDECGFIHFHLHYMLNVGDRWVKASNINNVEELLKRRVWSETYSTFLVNPKDELVLLDLRMELKHGKRAYHDKKILQERNWILSQIDINDDLKLVNQFDYTSYPRFSKLKFLILSAVRKYYRYYIELNRRKFSNYSFGRRGLPGGGRIVALVGVDGSGKSTTLSALYKRFGAQMDTSMVFTGYGLSGSKGLRKLLYLIRNRNLQSSGTKSDKYGVLKLVYLHYGLYLRKRRLRNILKYYSNGKLVLCDRWPQMEVDSVFDGKRLVASENRGKYYNYLTRLEDKVFNEFNTIKPNLIIKMNVSSDNVIKRKPEDYRTISAEKYIDVFNKIKYNSCSVIDIDANLIFENVLAEAEKRIWQII